MHERLLAEAGDRERREVDAAEFVAVYEGAYADDMDWRLERGGATVDEVRRIAENMHGEFSEADIEAAQEAMEEIAEAEAMKRDLEDDEDSGP